jgi:hypothetical protein
LSGFRIASLGRVFDEPDGLDTGKTDDQIY